MKQGMSAGDLAALQALVGLAGALAVATVFAVFFRRRRSTAFAIFEIFAIVLVFTGAGITAALAVALLHSNEAITDRNLTEVAMPLVISTILLVAITTISRSDGKLTTAYLLTVGVVVAVQLSVGSWNVKPEEADLEVFSLLATGGLLALVGWIVERWEVRKERQKFSRALHRRRQAGYQDDEKPLRLQLPKEDNGRPDLRLRTWSRRGKLYLDAETIERLRRHTQERWQRLTTGKAQPPVGAGILLQVELRMWSPWLDQRRWARISIASPDATEATRIDDLRPNSDGLYEVTGLGIV